MISRIYLVYPQSEWDIVKVSERFPNALRAGLRAVGSYFIKTILPRHFKGNNKYRYRHEPRSARYEKRKYQRRAKTGQPAIDMVWSGKFRDEALSRSNFTVRDNECVVHIRGRVLNLPRYPKSHVDLKAEMATVTDGEREECLEVFRGTFTELIKGLRAGTVGSSSGSKKSPKITTTT